MATARRIGKTWVAVVVLAALVAGVYGNTLRDPFVLDDYSVVTDNASIRDLRHIGRVLTPPGNGAPVQGRPVANLTIAINYALGGEGVVGYRVGNLFLHFLNCVLLFALVRLVLSGGSRGEEPGASPAGPHPAWGERARGAGSAAGMLAFAAAVLWAVHPLASAAVDYVSQRTELLAAFFFLVTLYLVMRGATAQSARRRWAFDVGAVAACALGLASKEVVATAPVVALFLERIFVEGPWREWVRRRGPTYLALAATWGLLAGLMIHSGTRGGTAGVAVGVSPWRYMLTQCEAVTTYLKLVFWPHPLIFDYGPALATGLRDAWPAAALVVALLAVTGWMLWRYPRAGFLAAAWWLVLAPSSSVIPVRTQTMGEHRAYLPLAIVLVGIVVAAARLGGRLVAWWRWAGATALAGSVIVLALVTFQRNRAYATDLGLWQDTLAKRPNNPRAYLNVAVIDCVPRGDYAAAIDCFTKALRLDPDFTDALVNRCSVYLMVGDAQAALADAQRLVRVAPGKAQAYLSRAAAWEALGEHDRQAQDATVAIALAPQRFDGHYDRGNAYLAQNRYPLAIDDYTQAIRLNPRQPHVYYNRGNAEFYLHQNEAALADYDRALALKPDEAAALLNRGIAHAALRQHDLAIIDFSKAAELQPARPDPYLDRAASYAATGAYDQAWRDVRAARERGGTPHPEFIRTLTAASGRGE